MKNTEMFGRECLDNIETRSSSAVAKTDSVLLYVLRYDYVTVISVKII